MIFDRQTAPIHASAGSPDAPRVDALVDTIPCALYGYVRWPDGRNRFVYISAQCEEIFGHPPGRVVDDPALLWSMVHPNDVGRLEREDEASNRSGQPFRSEVRIVLPSGEIKWIQLASMPSPQVFQGQVLWTGVIIDITERKRAEEENARLVGELREALSRIRTLEGIVPICSFCKKIRDPGGTWADIDVYIRRHSDADFSHGICPDCEAKHYPDV